MNEVHILHGKGNGILRQISREYLGSIKEVKKFQDAPLEQGGSGITIVTFK
jgi:DNA mismatch repair protein MutS2